MRAHVPSSSFPENDALIILQSKPEARRVWPIAQLNGLFFRDFKTAGRTPRRASPPLVVWLGLAGSQTRLRRGVCLISGRAGVCGLTGRIAQRLIVLAADVVMTYSGCGREYVIWFAPLEPTAIIHTFALKRVVHTDLRPTMAQRVSNGRSYRPETSRGKEVARLSTDG